MWLTSSTPLENERMKGYDTHLPSPSLLSLPTPIPQASFWRGFFRPLRAVRHEQRRTQAPSRPFLGPTPPHPHTHLPWKPQLPHTPSGSRQESKPQTEAPSPATFSRTAPSLAGGPGLDQGPGAAETRLVKTPVWTSKGTEQVRAGVGASYWSEAVQRVPQLCHAWLTAPSPDLALRFPQSLAGWAGPAEGGLARAAGEGDGGGQHEHQ